MHQSARLPQGDDSSAAFRDVLGFRLSNLQYAHPLDGTSQ
ncbi:hypothetical protein D805_1197 [Bifidobacterium thermophilum RBL67]|uniref:Uncharacterized protein n=1 Tax=Bifidobacterium thermophilum RBL67 TaxID=1254439 RepID=M4RH24_9BIFI|nr:hypothetical protein D805_1197 [Bifidobacterium thermophilum RBL67]